MDDFIKNDDIRDQWLGNFVTVKVNFSPENRNETFLIHYPEIAGYPHFFVLKSDGTFLHSQDTAELESGRGYSEEVMKSSWSGGRAERCLRNARS